MTKLHKPLTYSSLELILNKCSSSVLYDGDPQTATFKHLDIRELLDVLAGYIEAPRMESEHAKP